MRSIIYTEALIQAGPVFAGPLWSSTQAAAPVRGWGIELYWKDEAGGRASVEGAA